MSEKHDFELMALHAHDDHDADDERPEDKPGEEVHVDSSDLGERWKRLLDIIDR